MTLLAILLVAGSLLVQTYGYILLIPTAFSALGAVLAFIFFDWDVRHLVATFSIQFGLATKLILAYLLGSFGQLKIKEIALGIIDVPVYILGLLWLIKRRAIGCLIFLALFQTFGIVADCIMVTRYSFEQRASGDTSRNDVPYAINRNFDNRVSIYEKGGH